MLQKRARYDYSWLTDSLFLAAILGGLFLLFLGNRPLFIPDEGRYAEIAREMVLSKDYVTPYLNGVQYFEKPVMFYWLSAAAIKLGGLNLWSLRSVNVLIGLLGCIFTYLTARCYYGRNTGLLAALVLASSTLYFTASHLISLDLPVTVFMSACLYAFLYGLKLDDGWQRRLSFWSAAAFAALAVLTKGLIGIVLPSLIVFSWIACMGEWRLLKRLYLPSSLCVFLLIAAPWHIIASLRHADFFHFYFIEQQFLRYTTKDIGHYQPIWFFIPYLIIGFFPWIIFLPQTLIRFLPLVWKHKQQYSSELFFLLWASIILVFFSFSNSKLIPYILPVLPPLAILTARWLHFALNHPSAARLRQSYFVLMILTAVIAYAFHAFPKHAAMPDPHTAKIWLKFASLFLIVGCLMSFISTWLDSHKAIAATIASSCLFLLSLLHVIPSVDAGNIHSLAQILQQEIKPQDEVIAYNQYYQDLPFYLKRRITVLNWQNELAYGMKHEDTHEWMINDNAFWQRWHSQQRVYVMMGVNEFRQFKLRYSQEKWRLLGTTTNNVLITNNV